MSVTDAEGGPSGGFAPQAPAAAGPVAGSFQHRLTVQLGRLRLANPILVASGTFGYAREMAPFVPFDRLGGIIPKTVTLEPRIGNPPPRTFETASGLLNSIGLDNDGLETFIAKHVPYLTTLPTAIIANIAGKSIEQFEQMATRLASVSGLAGVELNISCPNVSGGVDFGTNPDLARQVVERVRRVCDLPIIAKLTPNVTDIAVIAAAAKDGGADAVSLVNTFQGLAVNWRKRRAILGNTLGGLSGPAIKPLALRAVYHVRNRVEIPIIGVGGITNLNDVMEFAVAGASAVQVGTATFANPGVSATLEGQLPAALDELGAATWQEVVGTLAGLPVRSCAAT